MYVSCMVSGRHGGYIVDGLYVYVYGVHVRVDIHGVHGVHGVRVEDAGWCVCLCVFVDGVCMYTRVSVHGCSSVSVRVCVDGGWFE